MANKKTELGQFFTVNPLWLKKHIENFIYESKCNVIYDPFAGTGELLKTVSALNPINFTMTGLDIDDQFGWQHNDSLEKIPYIKNAIIITNPPYLAKQSASRKKIDLSKYFQNTIYDDVYLLALENMLKAQKYVIAIIPESFINSSFLHKNLLHSITVLEENPFIDTETPVCVVCFDGNPKSQKEIKIYKNDTLISTLDDVYNSRLEPKNNIKITFNDLNGWLGLRAVDSSNDKNKICFALKDDMNYDWENNIKVSSRHITLINMDVPENLKCKFIKNLNNKIQEIREKSADLALTAFKGNTKSGIRRRRIDFRLVRAILENVYDDLMQKEGTEICDLI
ncbi:MAG: SAM-dependent methyltransferase [Alphaproteobacteria bacterium]|nr:SAM-dependent methyltransferase [Alphaproteobacteria bacterium]